MTQIEELEDDDDFDYFEDEDAEDYDEDDDDPSRSDDDDEAGSDVVPVSQSNPLLIADLVEKTLLFVEQLTGHDLFDYQRELARRIIESLIINDGEEITALFSRQSGKTETIADVIAGCMILFPRLAMSFELFEKFKDGLWVGVFAPINLQAETLFSRIVSRLTSDIAVEFLLDPEIDDEVTGGGALIKCRGGSFCRQQTANPRAKIESKSYHLICLDEAQDADEYVVRKSISPMGAFYNATLVKSGTTGYNKGDFYRAIQLNKRRQTKHGAKQNHFEFDWRWCAKNNPNYAKFVAKERTRLGEDSDEFRLSYCNVWLLERGMFVTSAVMDELGDKSMSVVPSWFRSPVVVGIDPAKTHDSTVVTVVWVDWDRSDEFGYFEHRILNWLEIQGEDWEEQYYQICDFLSNYDVYKIAVDSTGVGDAVSERLSRLLPGVDVVATVSSQQAQSTRWKHLMQLVQRGMIGWPAHAKTRRLKKWKRFYQQMVDLEKRYSGNLLIAEAPKESEAHDDYPDSLALACILTLDAILPEVQVSQSPFYGR